MGRAGGWAGPCCPILGYERNCSTIDSRRRWWPRQHAHGREHRFVPVSDKSNRTSYAVPNESWMYCSPSLQHLTMDYEYDFDWEIEREEPLQRRPRLDASQVGERSTDILTWALVEIIKDKMMALCILVKWAGKPDFLLVAERWRTRRNEENPETNSFCV